jgi:hypothetical protein
MKVDIKTSGCGVPLFFFAMVFSAIFMTLKLTGVIDWSWWWVFSPVLFIVALKLFVLACVLGFVFLVAILAFLD